MTKNYYVINRINNLKANDLEVADCLNSLQYFSWYETDIQHVA